MLPPEVPGAAAAEYFAQKFRYFQPGSHSGSVHKVTAREHVGCEKVPIHLHP